MSSKNDDANHQGSGSNPLLSLGQDHALSYQQLDGSDVNQFGQSGSGSQSSGTQRNGQQYQQYQQYQQQGGAQGTTQQQGQPQQSGSGQQPQPLYFQNHPSQGGQANQYGQSLPHDFNYMQNGSSASGTAASASGNQTSGSNGSANAASGAGNNPNFNQQQFSDLMYNSFLNQLSQKQQPQSSQSINQQQLNMNPGAAGSGSSYMNPSMQRYYQNNLSGYPSMIDGNNQSMLQPSHQIQSQSGNQQLHQQMPQQQASVQFQQQQAIQQAQLQAQAQAQMQAQAQLQAQQQMQAQQHSGSRSHHATKGSKGQRGSNGGQGNAGNAGANAGQAGDAAGGKGGKGANGPKKLSTTQSRIEKRKQLKKQGPKRPSSAYFLFSMSIRNELLQQYPDAKVPELSKLASAKWKELTNDEKKPFYDEFRVNWEKYRVLRDEYEKTLPPKRPSGPFIQFTQEVRPIIVKENPDKNLIEITKLIGERWRNLNPVEKTKYTDAYKQKLKEWEKFYPAEELLKMEEQKSHRKSSKKHNKNAANNNMNAHNPNEMNLNLMGGPTGHPSDLDGSGAPQTINPASTDVNSLANGMIKND